MRIHPHDKCWLILIAMVTSCVITKHSLESCDYRECVKHHAHKECK